MTTFGAAALLALAVGIAFGVGGAPEQEAELVAGDGAVGDYLGYSVALAGDTVVAGAPYDYADDSSGFILGAAYVFTRTGTTWTQQAKLTAADAANGDYFGWSVALAGDTAIVGPRPYPKNSKEGAAYVFTRLGTTWTQEAKLTTGAVADDEVFGTSVALGGDTALLGTSRASTRPGAVHVFTRTGTTWTRQVVLTASDATNDDFFGHSVALAGDTALVGAYGANAGPGRGAVYVFTRKGAIWVQEAKLTAADAARSDTFGGSVALTDDTAVVGAPNKYSGPNNVSRGAVYVFTRTGTTWTQQAKLTPADAEDFGQFGHSVAVADDTAVVGSPGTNSDHGAAYVFTRTWTTWTQRAKITAADADAGNPDNLGWSAAVAGDTAAIGAIGRNGAQGAADVFILSPQEGPPGYCLPARVKAKASASHPEKSTLAASGTFDTGSGVPDFSGAATFDVGGFHLDIPALVAKRGSLTYKAGGLTLKITPAKNGSSRARFSVKAIGDLTGKVGLDAPLVFNFTNAANNLNGTARLTAGALGPHGVTAPKLSVLSASATLKGSGGDALKLTLGFAADGTVPPLAENLTISFGDAFTAALPAASFVPGSNPYVYTAKAPGITKAVVDYVKGTITIVGKGLDLAPFHEGGNAIVVTVTRGRDTRSARIRMALAGGRLSY